MIDYRNIQNVDVNDFTYIYGHRLGLPVDMAFDDSFYCLYYNSPLIVFFRNSYTHTGQFVPIVVDKFHNIHQIMEVSKLYRTDLEKILDFISKYRNELHMLSIKTISSDKFIQIVNSCNERYDISNVFTSSINEMCKLSPIYTGLIADIWIDNIGAGEKCGHSNSERLKFQSPKNNNINREWPEMILNDFRIISKNSVDWSRSDIEKLKVYITVNRQMLHTSFVEHWDDETVKNNSIPIDDNNKPVEMISEEPYKLVRHFNNGTSIIKNKDGLFNLLKTNNEIFDENNWYYQINTFKDDSFILIDCNGNTQRVFLKDI